VVEDERKPARGGGMPELLLTGRDEDPETGETREGDSEQPALWQEVADYQHNVWWLNLENPAALFHFEQRHESPIIWRSYHAQKLVDMVNQVYMQEAYSRRPDGEREDLWAAHKAELERFEVQNAQQMWDDLRRYVADGDLE
jgi:hypothetical protein